MADPVKEYGFEKIHVLLLTEIHQTLLEKPSGFSFLSDLHVDIAKWIELYYA